MDINFLIIAWRGFSGNMMVNLLNEGFILMVKVQLNWLIEKGVDEKNLILYGESLGTGVATHLAQNKKLCRCNFRNPIYFNVRCCQKILSLHSG